MSKKMRKAHRELKGFMCVESPGVLVPCSFSIKKEFAYINYSNWVRGGAYVDTATIEIVPVTITIDERKKNK